MIRELPSAKPPSIRRPQLTTYRGQFGLDNLGKPEGFVARAVAGWLKRGALVTETAQAKALINDISSWLERQRFLATCKIVGQNRSRPWPDQTSVREMDAYNYPGKRWDG